MAKSLHDYKQEIAPKTTEETIEEFKVQKYRAIDALYIGIFLSILWMFLIFSSNAIFKIKSESTDDYIEAQKSFIWILIIVRCIVCLIIISFANKLNRNPLGWIIFGFFTPLLALITIGLTKKNDNNFYEFQNSINKEDFFSSLSLTEKLKLYKHIFERSKISPKWFSELSNLNTVIFANEQTSLETLNEYDKIYGKNFLIELQSNLPGSLSDRHEYLKSLEHLGIKA